MEIRVNGNGVMNVNFYVIFTPAPNASMQSQIGVIAARSCAEAFKMASREFQKKNGLPTSFHLNHKRLFDSSDKYEAYNFYDELMEAAKSYNEMVNPEKEESSDDHTTRPEDGSDT